MKGAQSCSYSKKPYQIVITLKYCYTCENENKYYIFNNILNKLLHIEITYFLLEFIMNKGKYIN